MHNSKSFCSAPWMHLHVINDGRAYPCCMTPLEDKYQLGNVKEQSLFEIMNSDRAKKMRVDMQNGILPESCMRCKSKEDAGMPSMRTGMVDRWLPEIQDLVDDTEFDGTINELRLKYWDFRFSNYCNLSCRTCSPIFSTSWAADYKAINGVDMGPALIDLKEAPVFWEDIEKHIDSVQEIHFAGGEPVLMEEHWRLLDILLEKGLTNVKLKYSTNATVLTYKKRNILDVWKQFKYVHLSLSIDGVGDTFEVVRNRGKWKQTEDNLIAISKSGVDYWVHPTVSILNIYRIPELHNRLLEIGVLNPARQNYWVTQFHINPLFIPHYYSITSLPVHHKQAVKEILEEYGKEMAIKHNIPFSGWQSIIDFMYSSDTSHQWKHFLKSTKVLDELRGQDLFRINPEFANETNI